MGGWEWGLGGRESAQGSPLEGKAPCRESRHQQQLDGGAVPLCRWGHDSSRVWDSAKPPPPSSTSSTHPRSPITWRTLLQKQRYDCQSPREAITYQPRQRKRLIAAHTPPTATHVTSRPLHYSVVTHSESTAGIFFPSMIRMLGKKMASALFKKKKKLSLLLQLNCFIFLFRTANTHFIIIDVNHYEVFKDSLCFSSFFSLLQKQ